MRNRIILIIAILLIIASITTTIAFAVPPSNPHIESGSAADGGNFFEYYSNGSWHDLKTPPHWVSETDEVAYCLEHKLDSADGELYYEFNPEAVYSDETYDGLLAILMHTYPYRNAGLTDQQIRYATANAIRSWLKESAGIGYDFMLPSNDLLQAKSSGAGAWNFYNQLLEKARDGEDAFINFSVKVSPSTVTLTESNGELTGTVTVTTSYCKNYTINYDKIPSGVTISGYTGESGDKLTITAPLSMQGQTKTLSKVFVGNNNRGSANFYWLDTSSGKQAVVVPVVDTYNPVAYGTLKFTSDEPVSNGYIEINKADEDTGDNLEGAEFHVINSSGTVVETLTTNTNGYAKSDELTEGTYSIEEITAPSGYILDTTTHNNIEVNADETTTVNLTNEVPVGIIRVIKTNDSPEDGDYSLEGAIFEIRDEDENAIETVTTDKDGIAYSSELPLGSYIVEEKTAPDGYVLNTKDFTVTLTYADQDTSIVYGNVTVSENPQTGIIVIDKKNSDTSLGDYSLQGAVFEIRNSSGTLVETVTTNVNGDAVSQRYPLGEYTVKEITAPYGYVLDDKEYTVNLKYGGQLYSAIHGTLTVYNTPQSGVIRVSKTNLNPSKGDYSLEGAVFEVYDANNKLVDAITTNNNGDASSKKLPLGNYTVREITAPYGYTLNSEVFNVSFNYGGQNNSVIYSDVDVLQMPQVGEIQITKINGNPSMGNHPLTDAIFEIRNTNGEMLDRVTTDENGIASSVTLPLGEYTITETQSPAGYIRNENEYTVALEYSNQDTEKVTASIEIPNEPMTGTITVIKEDAETGITPQGEATLNGAVFRISKVLGDNIDSNNITSNDLEFIEEIDCGEANTATISELPLGTYAIEEITAPVGYTINSDIKLVEITTDNTIVQTNLYNEVIKGTISITKLVDEPLALWGTEEYEYPLEGIKFEVHSKASGELVAELYTDRIGYVESKPLPYGTYIVSEPYPPTGYSGNEPFEVTIDTDDEVHEFDVSNNVLKADITIVKKDTDSDEIIPIAGTEFMILDATNKSVEFDGKKVFTTDETGTITLSEPLKYGDYTLQEITPPHGYWLNDESLSFTVWDSKPITLEFHNSKILKQIQIIKTDSRDDKRLLSGAVFEIYRDNELIETIITDINGQATTSKLPVGEYTIVEITAPVGFILDNAEFTVTISDDNEMIYTIECENSPTEVVLQKSDIADDKPLAGAVFEVYNENNEVVAKGETDKKGNIELFELPVGKYTFKEVAAPVGYSLDPNIQEFEILKNGTITGITKIQNATTEVTISKFDALDTRALSDAKIEITNSDDEVVFTGKTDENGEVTITKLPYGTYTFKEIEAPAGYILNELIFRFTIDEYGVVTGDTEITNCPTSLEISKVIYETNEPLTGAGFKIKNFLALNTLKFTRNDDGSYRYDKNGIVEEIIVDEKGTAIIYGLPFGNYWIEEHIVPNGYYPAAPLKITIDETNDTENSYKAVIPNSEFVNLGLNRERWIYPLVIGFTILIGVLVFVLKKRKNKK